ncbi:MAG: N-6 DNA methylase, partial [Thermoguttaceae bacterium]|nr:N-6 DNA methylase [Thermoguttaceae bacterium]
MSKSKMPNYNAAVPVADRAKKTAGSVYTPSALVEQILDLADYRGERILRRHAMENSCGDGAFLTAMVERYCRASVGGDLKSELETYIHGIELDPKAAAICVARLDDVAGQFGIRGVRWDVRVGDATTIRDYDGRMDFVLGNPPYVRVHNLGAAFGTVKRFELARGGMTDLYLAFYEIGLRMLTPNGVLGYITPSSFFNSIAGTTFRKKIISENLLRRIVDLKHYQAFDATAYTTIVILSRCSKKTMEYFEYDGAPQYVSTLNISDYYFNNNFYFGRHEELTELASIFAYTPNQTIDSLFEVKNGFATLADTFFIESEKNKFSFEKYIIPIVKASTGQWKRALFPYSHIGKPIAYEQICKDPIIKGYYEANMAFLKQRSLTNPSDWYVYGRTQGIKDVHQPKIAINTIIKD